IIIMLRFFVDSDSDITPELVEKYGFTMISMPYTIGDQTVYPYRDFKEFKSKEFYDVLRKGVLPSTSALNAEEYKEYFEPVLKAGDDILYVHFSAAMSGTFNSMRLALEELQEEYPNSKVYTIDTMAISCGALNPVLEIADMVKEGKSIDEIMKWSETELKKFAVYFYADDLKFFAKSGRVSGMKALMGNMLGIRPIIYMGDDGKMTSIDSCRGEKATIRKLVDYIVQLQEDIKSHRVIIAHGDAPAQAQKVADLLKAELGDDLNIIFTPVNPTAGSHCGPNTVGVSFHAKRKKL
ncbi:MAG: DegV family protein, partial [Bacilli bacterium]|nr:DegV family protein [Bacilli bacterium]